MRPNLHPRLINGRFGDPGLFVEMLHRRDALLFDLGDVAPLSTRDLLRVTHVFITHTHMDHFIGFDALLRVSVGRDKTLRMVGPAGFADRVEHRLLGYEWDLVERYQADLVIEAMELHEGARTRSVRFRFKRAFRRENDEEGTLPDGIVARGDGFAVRAAVLEHHGPCLGFAVAEPAHVNVWRNRLEERGLSTGAWLQDLKRAVLQGKGDETMVPLPGGRQAPLADLRSLVSLSEGQKIAYVTDVADTPANRRAIAGLADRADLLFIEASFAAGDADKARERAHLTTRAAGEIGRAAGARRLEAFHFSPRYEDEASLLAEVLAAFRGAPVAEEG